MVRGFAGFLNDPSVAVSRCSAIVPQRYPKQADAARALAPVCAPFGPPLPVAWPIARFPSRQARQRAPEAWVLGSFRWSERFRVLHPAGTFGCPWCFELSRCWARAEVPPQLTPLEAPQ